MIDERVEARIEAARVRCSEVEGLLSDPNVAKQPDRLRDLGRELSELRPIIDLYDRLKSSLEDEQAAKEMISESSGDDADALKAELEEMKASQTELESELREALAPRDPRDRKDAIIEIRAAAGGDEAGLFAGDLLEMYQRFAATVGISTGILSGNAGPHGGFKEVTLEVKGKDAYKYFKFESGVHRVQRVPSTESQGRIHTSTATVAVLPEADDVDIKIDPTDIETDVFRSSGPGGQSVNTTDSAVRLTHIPTGEVVACQEERSQLQNKERAMRILRARLYERAVREQQEALASERRGQVGSGGRSEKIRTYNFKENRVTDHRINLTLYRLTEVLAGDLSELVDAMAVAERVEAMAQG